MSIDQGREPTLWDIQRVINDLRDQLKSMVLRVEHEALARRVDELHAQHEKRLDENDDERKALRRLIYAALVSVVASAVLVSLRLKAGTP